MNKERPSVCTGQDLSPVQPGAHGVSPCHQACGEKIGTVMRTTHYSTLNQAPFFQNTLNTKTLNTMTSRMHAPHTTCPGCREEVYLDELVRGRCPLCGCTLEDFDTQESEIEDFIERSDLPWLVFNYFLFKRFLEIGASPLQIMQLVAAFNDQDLQGNGQKPDTRFVMEVPMNRFDSIRPKRCAKCGKIFVTKGRKVVAGDLAAPGVEYLYYCKGC